ncbi:choice-of-anchor I family protein [Desulfosarcina variabilis]|uniref:choice-of-anchor I family protein n=1 Tax=Desulfosarcina variabilis TaxID=2300 RepID=UPI003AFABAEE
MCRIRLSVLLTAIFLIAVSAAGSAAAQTARIAVIADPHFYDTDLGTQGAAFEAYLAQDRKMLVQSEAILASAVHMIKAKQPDIVLVPGDLTKDGERSSHEKFAAYLADLEASDIQVLVCPGNHDINNPHAVSFNGDTTASVPTVTPIEFADIYNEYGYGEAIERDPASLSYLAEPVPGLWVLALDVAIYEDNLSNGTPETGGAFRPETLTWALEKLAEARTMGKQVIAIEHHGITEHYTGQSTAFADYVIDDWQTVSATLANAGLQMVFTGHYHANDITETTTDDGLPTLFDIETGSLVTYPCPVRFVSVTQTGAAIHTEYISKIDYDTGDVSFPEYAENFLYEGLLGIAQYTLTNQYGLPEAQTTALAPYVADAFAAHYIGDETPDAATLAFIQGLLSDSDATVQFLGQSLYSLWTDLPPADANTFLDLGWPIHLNVAGTYATGAFDEGAAEIVDYDPATQRLFVVNGDANAIDVLDAADPENPVKLFDISLDTYGDGVNSVAVKDGIVAAAVQADPKQDPGKVVFFDTDGGFLNQVTVGALPDMLIFTPDGSNVLVANEGEPNDEYDNDPEGSVSVIDVSNGVGSAAVATADFSEFNDDETILKDAGVRIFGPGATVAQDLEPEYIAVSGDNTTAWITCQENNAVAVLDIASATITGIYPLGFKDHSLDENALDVSDRDDMIKITPYANLFGMYQPDAIKAFEIDGANYLITANEGDARDYDEYSEEERVKDLTLDDAAFPDAATLQADEVLGRLTVTTTMGDTGATGFEALYAFGTRSFSILTPSVDGLDMIFDSGSQIERLTAVMLPNDFNAANDENDSFDSRSDAKGPEPEAVTVGVIDGSTYAFIGLERVGGIMVYDVSDPGAPLFVQYINNRNFTGDAEAGTAGDLGPEGLHFISADDSPTGQNLLAAANEISGTTTLYTIDAAATPPAGDLDASGTIDRDDIALINFHRNQPAEVFPAADIDGDGTITVRDARKIVCLCSCPRCVCPQ